MRTVIFLILAISISHSTFSQSCIENDLLITTQEQIDNFSEDYPNCTNVLGSIEIIGTGSNITSLQGLMQLESIQGSLTVKYCGGLVDVIGIENIQTVGADFKVQNCHYILEAELNNLNHVGGDFSFGSSAFVEIVGLAGLNSVGGSFGIGGTPELLEVNIPSLSTVGQSFGIGGTNLTSLDIPELSYVPANFTISGNLSMSQVNVPNVMVQGGFNIQSNPVLTELNIPLQTPDFTGSIVIQDNESLSSVDFLSALTNIEGSVVLGQLSMTNINFLSNVTSIGGVLTIENMNFLSGLNDLSNLESIGGDLRIRNNSSLVNLIGLESISAVNGQFIINYNENLSSLEGIQNINEISAILCIAHNPNLVDVSNINVPYGEVTLELIDNESLSNTDGFENIAQLSGWIQIYNMPLLEDLNFLNNINTENVIGFDIIGNENLSVCNQSIICELLEENSDFMYFNNNAPGCNSIDEVQASCFVGVDELTDGVNSVYPNPSNGIFNVSVSSYESLTVYCSIGTVVLSQNKSNRMGRINLSDQPNGVYMVVINDRIGNQSIERIVKQ